MASDSGDASDSVAGGETTAFRTNRQGGAPVAAALARRHGHTDTEY